MSNYSVSNVRKNNLINILDIYKSHYTLKKNNNMNYLKKLLAITILACLFVACEKDNTVIDSEVETPDLTEHTESNPLLTRGSGDEEGLMLDCITVLFPFDLIAEDGSATTFTSVEDFETFDNGTAVYVDFGYPLNVSIDDVESSVEDGEALGELFASCVPSGGWEDGDFPAYDITIDNSCYTLNYPVQLINSDDEIITIESEEELIDALSSDLYFFVYPFDMTHEDGDVITVNNMDEIFEALIECNGFYGDEGVEWEQEFEYIGCYLFTFPFDVVLSDGEIVTVNDHMDFCDLMLVGEIQDFAYPLTLTDLDGTQIIVNSSEELEALLSDCEGWDEGDWDDGDWDDGDWDEGDWDELNFDIIQIWIGSFGDGSQDGVACYAIEYPITFTNVDDSSELIINSQEEYDSHFLYGFTELESYEGVYPMTVTYIESGEDFTITSSEDVITLLEGCE